MSRAYFISDSWSITGPSIVNSYYRKYLSDQYTFAPKYKNYFIRLIKDIFCIFRSKVIVFSGASKLDNFYLWLCKLLKKRIIYIMHGCIVEENQINHVDNPGEVKLEKKYFEYADIVLCVSPAFTLWVKKYFSKYKDKVFTLTNGIDWESMNYVPEHKDLLNTISIVGGGVPRKNVLTVCKAIEIVNKTAQTPLRLMVFGRDDLDSESIKRYPFVEFNGKVQRYRMLEKISCTPLFIQNSRFDSFALAPLEALTVGCSILCSRNVGAISIIENLEDCDIIQDCEDEQEIAKKIKYLLEHPNHDRIISNINKEATSYKARSKELENYITTLEKDKKCEN